MRCEVLMSVCLRYNTWCMLGGCQRCMTLQGEAHFHPASEDQNVGISLRTMMQVVITGETNI